MVARRFFIDGSMAGGGGSFTYLMNVLPELCRQAPADHFRVAVSRRRIADALPAAPNLEVDYLGELGPRGQLEFTYRRAGRRAAEWGADVYFSAGERAPLDAPCPTIAAFRNPNVFTWSRSSAVGFKQRARLWALWGLAAGSALRCDRVMFVSHDSAHWIGDSMRLPERKRAVIHHGIDASRWRRPSDAPRSGSYILSVSSVYAYKNYVRLIEAYTEVYRRRGGVPDLVIIGDDQDPVYSAKMAAARERAGEAAQAIHILGEVPYAEIDRYYREAMAFVFPSYLETFGHPLLEAMANGLPIVAADLPVFREVASDAAVYADPFDRAALAEALDAVVGAPELRRVMSKRGLERVRQFTWQRSAASLLGLFSEVMREREVARSRSRRRLLPERTRPTAAVARSASSL